MKNSNGSGSICKLKGKRRKPWYVRATIEFSSDGKIYRYICYEERSSRSFI